MITRWLCSLRGHDGMLKYEKDRLALSCHTCGWESAGWDLKEKHEEDLSRVDRERLTHRPLTAASEGR